MAAPDAKAQDDETTTETTTEEAETDPQIEALKKEKEKAELKKAIAEAEKATLEAKLPDTEGSGIEGDVTFGEGTGYFAEVLAYESLQAAAEQIVDEILGPDGKPEKKLQPNGETDKCKEEPERGSVLVVTGDELVDKAQLWEIASVRVGDMIERLEGLGTESIGGDDVEIKPTVALTTVGAVLSAAADIASFFRSDLALTARELEIPATALATSVAGELASRDGKPIIPAASLEQTQLMGKIDDLLTERRELVERRGDREREYREKRGEIISGFDPGLNVGSLAELKAELAKAEKALAEAKKKGKGVSEHEEKFKKLTGYIAELRPLEEEWDQVSGEIDAHLTATDELVKALTEGVDGKPSVVEAVAAVDIAKVKCRVPVLRVDLVGQGGEMHVRKSIWRTRLAYVGGVSAEYRLTDHAGVVTKAGVVTVREGRAMKVREVEAGVARN